MTNIIKVLYTVFMAFWRDSFGKNGWDFPIYHNRFVQHIVAFAMTFFLCFFDKDLAWYWYAWCGVRQ